jgi:hypothetical protein
VFYILRDVYRTSPVRPSGEPEWGNILETRTKLWTVELGRVGQNAQRGNGFGERQKWHLHLKADQFRQARFSSSLFSQPQKNDILVDKILVGFRVILLEGLKIESMTI